MSLTIRITGTPAPQGSKRAFVANGRARLVESSGKVKPWRQDVRAAALDALADAVPCPCPYTGPVSVAIVFAMPRPAAHYGTGRNAGLLRLSAPRWHAKRPDIDKLTRSTLDGLGEAGVWRDDSQVAELTVSKVYDSRAGAVVTIAPMGALP